MVVPVGALILAGSGINTQTSWGMTHGFHPSMYFLLSMPVTREQLLRIRVLMGLGLLFVWTVTTAGVVLLSTQWGKLAMDPGRVFATLPNLLVGAVLFYAFSVFLTAFLDEYWAGMTALLVMGMLGGYGVAEGPGGANLLAYMMSQSLVAGDLEAWAKAGIFLAISAAFYLAAWRVVAAKEY
ncbi:MAG: hypothetical protein OHK0021_10980 [Bryobacter sp.]